MAARHETHATGPFISMEEALMSRPLAIAAVLFHGSFTSTIYEASRNNPEILALATKVQILPQDGFGQEDARLEVTFADQRRIEEAGALDPTDVHLTLSGATEKFHRLARAALGEERIAKVADLVGQAETLPDISEVAHLLAT